MIPLMDQLVKLVDPLHRDLGQFFEDEVEQKFGEEIYWQINSQCVHIFFTSVFGQDVLWYGSLHPSICQKFMK